MELSIASTRTLNNGVAIPLLGFGVFQATAAETIPAVKWAIEAGYRHIDTAKIYGNEAAVGKAVQESGVPRESLFITTKLWNSDMRASRQREAFTESLKALQMDYVDLYLIHWPVDNFIGSWRILEEFLSQGRARAIGVSNFQPHHISALLQKAKAVPAVNQIEIHPNLTQKPLIALCEDKGIVCEAWSPIGGSWGVQAREEPVLKTIGKQYSKTPVQVMLRWALQRGTIPLPKSVRKERIVENSQLYDFNLTPQDMDKIDALNRDQRYGPDPDNFSF